MYRLNTFVHVAERPGAESEGRSATFGPADNMSAPENEWALAAISNPHVWAGEVPPLPEEPEQVDPATELEQLRARVAELEAAAAAPPPPGGMPPRGGPGSGAPEWRAYAASVEVEVAEDASREDVIAALEQAGKPTK